MVAVPLIFGRLTAADYEDSIASDPRIDALRDRITCTKTRSSRRTTMTPRSALHRNGITVEFNDGDKVSMRSLSNTRSPQAPPAGRHAGPGREVQDQPCPPFSAEAAEGILDISVDRSRLEAMPVHEYVDMFVI